jgi:hypothetical protein
MSNKKDLRNVITRITLETLVKSVLVVLLLFFGTLQSFNKGKYSNTKNNKSFMIYYSYKQKDY